MQYLVARILTRVQCIKGVVEKLHENLFFFRRDCAVSAYAK